MAGRAMALRERRVEAPNNARIPVNMHGEPTKRATE
jgi:hypothetical protein